MKKNEDLKVLFWDIETSHNIGAHFGLYDQNINYTDILQEWFIISVAWKWQGEKKVHSVNVEHDTYEGDFNSSWTEWSDYDVVKRLHEVLSEADVVVHHNGDDFDIKKFNARAIFHGLTPIPPLKTIDTLKIARKFFKFTSNRLDYLGQFLSLGKKMDTPKGLWLSVLKGNIEAVNTMVKYNKQDVILLEKVFDKFAPYVNNDRVVPKTRSGKCDTCGSTSYQQQGWRITKTHKYPRFKCNCCGSWFRGAAVDKLPFSLQTPNHAKMEGNTKDTLWQTNPAIMAKNTRSSTAPTKPKKTARQETKPARKWKKPVK